LAVTGTVTGFRLLGDGYSTGMVDGDVFGPFVPVVRDYVHQTLRPSTSSADELNERAHELSVDAHLFIDPERFPPGVDVTTADASRLLAASRAAAVDGLPRYSEADTALCQLEGARLRARRSMLNAAWAPPAESLAMTAGGYLERVVQGVRASWALFEEWYPDLAPALQGRVEQTLSDDLRSLQRWVAGQLGASRPSSRSRRTDGTAG
jgi:hypothetical protein